MVIVMTEEERLKEILLDLILRHRYAIKTEYGYRFVCEYNKDFPDGFPRCSNNRDGICSVISPEFPWLFLRKFNGRKMFKCPCG